MCLLGQVSVLQDLQAQLLQDFEAINAISQLKLAVLTSSELFNGEEVRIIFFLPLRLVNVIDSRRKWKNYMVLIHLFILVELELGDRQAKEENVFLAGNAGDVLQFLVDEGVQVGLEPLISQQFLGRVLLCTKVDDLDDPNGRQRCL